MPEETASPKRFRLAKGKLVAIDPKNKSEEIAVKLVYDQENRALGVVVEEGQLKGYVIFVSERSFELTKERGVESDRLVR